MPPIPHLSIMQNIENVILDRDGTIIVDKHYLHDPVGVELFPGVGEGLAALCQHGIRLFIATNQSGIGRGYFPEADYHAVEKQLESALAEYGVTITGTAFCPHAPDTDCTCRKPGLGMWQKLSEKYGLTPNNTAMVGDKDADVRFGLDAGLVASILVLTGKGAKQLEKYGLEIPASPWVKAPAGRDGLPTHIAVDLGTACTTILHHNAMFGDQHK